MSKNVKLWMRAIAFAVSVAGAVLVTVYVLEPLL
jgi:hypothetical protein